MAPPPQQPGPLAFGDFLEHLRRQGFTIGVDHHLRLQRLLAALGGRCAPQDLKTLLCPVFATNEKEQQSFHRAFDSYYDLFQIPDESEGMIDLPPGLTGDQEKSAAPSVKSKRRFSLIYAALTILLIALAVLIANNHKVREQLGLAHTPTPSPPPSPEPTIAPTPEVLPPEAAPPVVVTPIQTPTPQPRWKGAADFVIAHRNAIRIAAVVIPLLCFLIYELIRYRRRKLIIERAQGRKPPRAWPIVAPSPDLKDYRSERFYKAARGLRRRQVGEFQRLDVARTIAATIEARGYPNFRYRADSRAPEYLILIDRASWRDHQSQLFDALARAMEREGLFTKRYFYDGDPRVCTDDSTNRAVHLTDLQKKYSSHRLLIFGDGERLIDPVSGRFASWAALLLEWPDRALLTPEARRGLREKTLADHFILLPATLEGLDGLAERFDLPTVAEFDTWELNGEPAPPEPEGAVKIEALRPYLGEETFQWLCACAVYPELHWDLTLHLGSLPRMGAGLIGEKNLLRLIRFPWFRTGSMPDELRLRLIGELEPERERAVRSAIIELLEKNPAPQGTFAADARKLEIAAQRSWLSRDNRKELRQAVGEIKQIPPGDVVRNYALVRFLESAPNSRLAMLVPRWLRRVFYEGGVPAFGVKNGVRLVATLTTMTVLWFSATGLLPVRPDSDNEGISVREIVTLEGHESPVSSVAFSPDGKTLATGSRDQTAKLWDAATRRELATLKGHRAPVNSVAFSPDGKTLATASYDLTAKLWDVNTRRELATLIGHESIVTSVAFSPDEKLLATGSYDRTAKLWDVATGWELGFLVGHKSAVSSVAFSPDGKALATGSVDRTVKLWDVNTRRELATLTGHESTVFSVAFSPDGNTLATASDDHTVKLWDVATRRELGLLTGHQGAVFSVEFSPDGTALATGSDDRTAKLWDVATRRELATIEGNGSGVSSVAFSPDGKTLATGNYHKMVKLWDISGIAASVTPQQTQSPTPTPTARPASIPTLPPTSATGGFGAGTATPRPPTPTPSPTATPPTLARFSVSPRSLDFGTVNLSGSASRSVVVTNTGATPYKITSVDIGSTRVAGFEVGKNSCSGANFQPRERCSIEVIFSPLFRVNHSTNLSINTTVGQQTVSLTGAVVVPSQPAEPTITEFTATPAGNGTFTICYGMRDAVSARIDPDIGEVQPTKGDCIAYRVPRTTNYTLTATGRDGRTVSRQLTVSATPLLPVEIIYFRAQPSSILKAGRVQLCYGVVNARSARIDQDVGEIKPSEKDCVYVSAKETTTYMLTATGYDGKTVARRFTLRIGPGKAGK